MNQKVAERDHCKHVGPHTRIVELSRICPKTPKNRRFSTLRPFKTSDSFFLLQKRMKFYGDHDARSPEQKQQRSRFEVSRISTLPNPSAGADKPVSTLTHTRDDLEFSHRLATSDTKLDVKCLFGDPA